MALHWPRKEEEGSEERQGGSNNAVIAEKLAKVGGQRRLVRFAENARPGRRNTSGGFCQSGC